MPTSLHKLLRCAVQCCPGGTTSRRIVYGRLHGTRTLHARPTVVRTSTVHATAGRMAAAATTARDKRARTQRQGGSFTAPVALPRVVFLFSHPEQTTRPTPAAGQGSQPPSLVSGLCINCNHPAPRFDLSRDHHSTPPCRDRTV